MLVQNPLISLDILACLPLAPTAGAGTTRAAVFLLARLPDKHPPAAGTLLHRGAVGYGLSELNVRCCQQVGRALRQQKGSGTPRPYVQEHRGGNAYLTTLQLRGDHF